MSFPLFAIDSLTRVTGLGLDFTRPIFLGLSIIDFVEIFLFILAGAYILQWFIKLGWQ